jgi:hypothetical protein
MGKKATKPKASATEPEATETAKYVVRSRFSDTDEVFEIDLLDLTGKEEMEIEGQFDRPLAHLWNEGWITASASGRIFVSYLARRRVEPNFTYDQALEFDPQIVRREEGEEETRPTDGPKKSGSPA